jgi:hypothetical protein
MRRFHVLTRAVANIPPGARFLEHTLNRPYNLEYMGKVSLFLVMVWMSSSLFGQSDRGTLTGQVTDPSGAAVPHVTVVATNQATGVKYTSTTTDSGNYVISQLPPGAYEISAEAPGFRKRVQRDVNINVAQTSTLNPMLELGPVEQVIEVTGAAPVIESTTSDVGTVVPTRNVIDLPLAVANNMRSPESFIFLTPGVTTDNPRNPTQNVQINGSPSRAKEIVFDGASAANPESGGILFTYPSVEAVQEFKLLSTNYSAEYGRTGGGFEIFTAKSGGNEFHGSAFEYFRNEKLDARDRFAATRQINRQHEFGAALGGPVWIPHVYQGRNRTFFHFVYGGFRWRAGAANELLTLPTAAMRQGDFSGIARIIYDPQTGQPFPENKIPAARFSTVAKNILPLIPAPLNANLTSNYRSVGRSTVDRDQYNIKVDHNLSDRNRLSGYLYVNTLAQVDPERLPVPLSSALDQGYRSRWARLNDDFIFSPATLNHFTVAYTRENQFWQRLSANQGWPQKIGLTGVWTGTGNAFPVFTFTDSLTPWGDAPAAGSTQSKSVGQQANNVWQFTDTLSHMRGSHSLKFGADLRFYQTNGADPLNSQGRFDFSSVETASPIASERPATGNAFASFLLGQVDAARYNELAVVPGLRYRYFATFVQDDWKVSPRLTINIGLRWDVYFPRTERFNNLSGFDPTLPNPGAGGRLGAIAFLGEGPGRNRRTSFADTYYRALGPRVGFAYSVSQKTVLRGGYGIAYAAGNANVGLRQSQSFSVGFNAAPTWQSSGNTAAFQLDQGLPQNYARPPFIDPTVANGFDASFMGCEDARPPYFQNFTFGVQRELPKSILAEASYVGVKGTRLGTALMNFNELDPRYLSDPRIAPALGAQVGSQAAIDAGISAPYPGFRGTVAQALRPYPQYLNIISRSNPNGNSTYHALQAKLEKRFSSGLTFLAAYTWSKSISDADQIAGLGPAGQTYYNRALEKAISTNDIPHSLAISYVYELPFGQGKRFLNRSGVLDKVVGGWTLTGIQQYQSGRPIVLTATSTLPIRTGTLRPDVVPGVARSTDHSNFDPAVDRWINRAAFGVPGALRYGTAARSYTDLRADGFRNESFGLIKRTKLTEHVALTFRAEFFNALNRVVYGAPDGNVSNASFGRVTSQANLPRQGQLALRLDF